MMIVKMEMMMAILINMIFVMMIMMTMMIKISRGPLLKYAQYG
jgi:hypothetical protein